MNIFSLLGALPEIEAEARNIDKALRTLRWYMTSTRAKRVIATVTRLLNDPDVKDAIAFLQLAAKDPNVLQAVDTAIRLDDIIIKRGLSS